MRAELKSLVSFDAIDGLETWSPSESDFGVRVIAFIGSTDSTSSDAFDILVCTPAWFASRLKHDEARSGAHTIFMTKYDCNVLEDYANRFVEKCEADSWPELALECDELGAWEFRYRHYPVRLKEHGFPSLL
jgi:hypothetical protein